MRRRFMILVIALVAVIGLFIYVTTTQNRNFRERLNRIPTYQPHQHLSVSGEVVEHIHTYHPPTSSETSDLDNDKPEHPILQAWERLDLEVIRRDYQPYTVQEMIEKWDEKYIAFEYPHYNMSSQGRLALAEEFNPIEKWLERFLDLGYPFLNFHHYTFAYQWRGITRSMKVDYDNPEKRTDVCTGYKLPVDATWEEVEELIMKWRVVSEINEQRARDVDSTLIGGTTNLSGVFKPYSGNTLYVHISDDKTLITYTGTSLTKKQKRNLEMFGIAPKGIHVIYTDAKGRPLPPGTSSGVFGRQMKVLEDAQKQIEKIIADHEVYLKTPSKLAAQRNTEQQFELLQELHGGDLPKDLMSLQEIITELEAFQREARKLMQPKEDR